MFPSGYDSQLVRKLWEMLQMPKVDHLNPSVGLLN